MLFYRFITKVSSVQRVLTSILLGFEQVFIVATRLAQLWRNTAVNNTIKDIFEEFTTYLMWYVYKKRIE